MSGGRASRGGKRPKPSRITSRRRSRRLVAALILCLFVSAAALTRWLPRPSVPAGNPTAPASAAGGGDLHLAKEYIYAGGRMVAIEEPTPAATPTPTPSGPPPTNLLASFNPATGTVTLTWTAPASGSISGYVVERLAAGGQFTALGPQVTGNSFSDQAAAQDGAYLYRVAAVFAGGAVSAPSNSDLATAVAFSDDPLVSAAGFSAAATSVRAAHFTQLREAINAVRALAGLSGVAWTFPTQQGAPVKLEDLVELRVGLGQARQALGLPAVSYTDPEPARGLTPIRRAHVQELREAVR